MKYWIASLALFGAMGIGRAHAQDAASAPATPAPAAAMAPADAGTGTLVVEVQPFTSEKPLPAKIETQLKSTALEWGIRDHQVVFSTVAKQFLDFPMSHMLRYGQSESLTLPAGEYRITGIGLEMNFGFNVQKILNKGAFVNEDVVTFRVEPGKTTTLSIHPVFAQDNAGIVAFYLPTLKAIVRNDSGTSDEQPLNVRGDHSIAWPDYHGSLKFVAK
jgi:hypothetical protein